MPRSAALVLLALAAALPSAAAAQAPQDDPAQPLVYVISIDGLDGDRVDAGKAPFVNALLQGAQGGQATYYRESRSVMVAETNPNHVAMATGAFGDKSGIPGNSFAVYNDASKAACGGSDESDPPGAGGGSDESTGSAEQTDGERAPCVLAENFFASIKRQTGGGLTTAGVFGKPKLAQIFASRRVDPKAYDATYLWSPCDPRDPSDFCDRSAPARPNDGYAITDEQVMNEVVETIEQGVGPENARRRAALTFVNLPTVDAAGHGFGVDSGTYDEAIGLADAQIERLVARLKDLGLWQRSVLFLVSDHSMDTTLSKRSLRLAFNAGGVSDGEILVVQNGSVDMVYLADRTRKDRDEVLKRLRQIALAQEGVDEALYRLPNAADGGARHTLDAVHPGWRIAGPRTGDLFVTHEKGGAFNEPNPLTGNHGSGETSDNTFAIASGRPALVRQQALAGAAGPRFDDTLLNPGQAQNVDVAPTAMALLGLAPPAQSEGRVLGEAFLPGALNAFAAAAPRQTPGARESDCVVPQLQVAGSARGRGRGLQITAASTPTDVDLFQQSRGRVVLGNRRVVRFRGRRGTFRWSGRRGSDGIYVLRMRAGTAERRIALRRTRGRFRVLARFEQSTTCGLLTRVKLERPVFGGRSNRALGISFAVAREARVSVEVRRGRRVVRRFPVVLRRAGVTHRLRLASERLPRGTYTVRVTATTAAGERAVAVPLASRRL
jgi:hypothetical protein